eukprot:1179834-Prorocentrum_minimum.AAC.2
MEDPLIGAPFVALTLASSLMVDPLIRGPFVGLVIFPKEYCGSPAAYAAKKSWSAIKTPTASCASASQGH